MNDFFSHIEFLLLRHDCVIVPGLGALITAWSSATIDMEKGILLPPSRTIVFNSSVSNDDGLLANSIARKEGLTFEESRQVIARNVSIIKESLLIHKFIQLGNIGSLSVGEEGKLIFAPAKIDYSDAENSGFLPIDLFKSNLDSNESDRNFLNNQETSHDADKLSDRRNHGFNRKFIQFAASFMILSAIALTFILNPIPSDNRQQKASVVPVESIISISNDKEKLAEEEVINENEEVVSEVIVNNEPESIFYLIVATFSNFNEAENYVEKYSTENYPLTVVASKKMTRVSVASSSDKEDLRKKLNSKEIHSRFPNAWIWSHN